MSSEEKKQKASARPHPSPKSERSRRVRTGVVMAAVAILIVSATAAMQFYAAYRLPDPETADADGLIRWLVTTDLTNYSSEVQDILARRLEEEFGATTHWGEFKSRLPDPYRSQLWNNIQILLRPWFFEKMRRYYASTPSRRSEVVDRLLDQIRTWRGIVELAPPGRFELEKPDTCLAFVTTKLDQWKETSSPEEAKRLDEFVSVIQTRWLLHQLAK